MELKKCTKCKVIKPVSMFDNKSSAKDGLFFVCKQCWRKKQKIYYEKNKVRILLKDKERYKNNSDFYYKYRRKYKTDINVFIRRMHYLIKNRCWYGYYKNRNYKICDKEEFRQKALNDDNLLKLYKDWISSDYDHKLVPTADRIDSSRGYSIDNIQFITFIDNCKKSNN